MRLARECDHGISGVPLRAAESERCERLAVVAVCAFGFCIEVAIAPSNRG